MAAQIREVVKKPEIMEYLIKKEANVIERNRQGQMPVHCAVLSENQLNVDFLLTAMKNEYAKKSLELAGGEEASSNQTTFRAWLAEIVDDRGESPLHYAARLNHLPIALVLISFGFDLSQKSSSGCYPHDLCTDQDVRTVLYGTI